MLFGGLFVFRQHGQYSGVTPDLGIILGVAWGPYEMPRIETEWPLCE